MKQPYRSQAERPIYIDSLPPRRNSIHVPFVKACIHLIALMTFVLVVSANEACAWFQKNEPYFPTPADVSCVYAAVESGVQDPAGIIAACPALAALAIEDLIKLISGIVLGRAHRIEAEKAKASSAAVSVSGPSVHVQVVPADAGPLLYKYSDGGGR